VPPSVASPPPPVKHPAGDSPPGPARAGALARLGKADESGQLFAGESTPPVGAPPRELRKPEVRQYVRWARERQAAGRTTRLVQRFRHVGHPEEHLTGQQAIQQRKATTPEAAEVSGHYIETVWETEALPPRDIMSIRGDTKTDCTPELGKAICVNGHWKPVAYACGLRRCHSKVCRDHARAERSRTTRPLIVDSFGDRKWGKVVLTYDPRVQEILRDRRLHAAARALAQATLEAFFLDASDLGKGWRMGMVSVDHPCGDGDQTERGAHHGHVDSKKWYPHHNFLFPLCAFKGRLRDELECWIDLDELRARWKRVQEAILGEPLKGNVDVWYGWAQTKPAKLELCSYFPRTFPDWPGTSQRLSYYGAFGCRVLHTLPEAANLVEDEDDERGICGECGAPYTRVVLDVVDGSRREGSAPHGYRLLKPPPDSS
jgi:hypothetical protein